MTRLSALGVVMWTVFVALPARADPPSTDRLLRLELRAPASCPGRQPIVDAVARLVDAAPATPLEARVAIAERDGRFQAELTMLDGQRRIEGATCRAVSHALVVILALTIDPQASTHVGAFDLEPETATEPAKASAATPSEKSDPSLAPVPVKSRAATPAEHAKLEWSGDGRPSADSPTARAQFRFGGSALLLSEIGMLPGPAIGGLGLVRGGREAWHVELAGAFLLPRSEPLASKPTAGGELRWLGGQLNGCAGLGRPFSLCLGAELGRISAFGFGVSRERTAAVTWLAAVSTASVRFDLNARLAFEGRLALAVPTTRPTFGLNGEALHRAEPVSGRALLGLGFR